MRNFVVAVALLVITPAVAADVPRAIDFTVQLRAIDGTPATECKETEVKVVKAAAAGEPDTERTVCRRSGPITLGEVAAAGLMTPDQGASLEDQIKRGRLAQRVVDGKAVDLTADDIALIKARIGKLGITPLYVAQAVAMLDPAAVK